MDLSIEIKKGLKGQISAPQSKSYMQRALTAALLNEEETIISPLPQNGDNQNMLELIKNIGAKVKFKQNSLIIKGIKLASFKENKLNLNCGESALSLRMFLSILSLTGNDFILDGAGSLKTRKIKGAGEFLNKIGIKTDNPDDMVPFFCQGKLRALKGITLDCSETSQLLTGLLMALPLCKEDSSFKVLGLRSKGYIDITLDILNSFGIQFENIEYKNFIVPGNQKYKKNKIFIEGDWSGTAFFMVGAAISQGEIKITGLNINSKQPDRVIIKLLKETGVTIEQDKDFLKIKGGNRLKTFSFDGTHYPDLIPALILLGAFIKGKSIIKGGERLINKESNRLNAIMEIFKKIGYKIKLQDNIIEIEGGEREKKNNKLFFHSYNDHRIAMLISLLPILINKKVTLSAGEAIDKSYANFYNDLVSLGGKVS